MRKKDLVFQIVKLSSFVPMLCSGDILDLYNRFHKDTISLRHLYNLLRELEADGKVKLKVVSHPYGFLGRTTIVQLPKLMAKIQERSSG